ncbi:MAG: aminotransferase class V-fold PLP-dependent enzyme [Verrucomicrobia bacterium]|nr:aminotransferase class V-fold PLP-dependent enzyme [Verrucomicrobiota bacterium]MBI3867745.1 aminotransferase class V-fold PLP-dependent enzyme [Verrucomicrobiota bacterium]
MTIAELHADEVLRQAEFPVTRGRIFLGHAGVCPLPRRVADAVAHLSLNSCEGDQEAVVDPELLSETRALAARLIGSQPDEIALVGPTSLGLSLVANGLRLRRGENVLVYLDDYPSNVYPWMAMAERGIQVRLLNIRELGRIRPVDVLGQIDEQTKLVALASCHFVSGWRIDLEAIGKILRDRRIPFCVDAIQTLGAFPTPAAACDFIAADAHKWLLGPCAAGILYVRKEYQEWVRPTVYGWHNIRSPQYLTAEEIQFRKDARRYEAGSANLLGIAGLRAALRMILDIGVADIAAELHRKRAWIIPALEAKGYSVLQSVSPAGNAGGIISFHKAGGEMSALHQKLAEKSIVTSLRGDRAGNQYIRISPHFYNTDEELHRFLAEV